MAEKRATKRKPAAPKSAAKSKRKQFTPEQRAKILADANSHKLTGKQVAKRHGISTVTYYLWRSKAGGRRRPRAVRGQRGAGGDLGSQVRGEVQAKIRQILPAVVRAEVSSYLDSVFGSARGRRARG